MLLKKKYNKINFVNLFFLIIITYLVYGTGIHSDDYTIIEVFEYNYIQNLFNFKTLGQNIFAPGNYYLIYWIYYFAGNEYIFLYEILKIIICFLSFLMIYLFFTDYFEKRISSLISFLFIFYPVHDSINYWLMTCGFILTLSLSMFAVYLVKRDYFKLSFFISLLGSFTFYSSPPFVLGLGFIFLYRKKYLKFFIIIAPIFIYLTYYLFLKFYYDNYSFDNKINNNIGYINFFLNFILQVISAIDTQFGINFFLKIFNSFSNFNFYIIFILPLIFIIYFFNIKSIKIKRELIFSFLIIILISLIMFSFSGRYFHSSFNLGNRTTIYSSFVLFFILAYLSKYRLLYIIFISIIFISIFNLSNHWKLWNIKQNNIINNLKTNQDLSGLTTDYVYFINNGYSSLGKFSHIDFIVTPWLLNTVTSNMNFKSIYLNSNVIVKSKKIYNKKYKSYYPLYDENYVYDTENNALYKLSKSQMFNLVSNFEIELRHWSQIVLNNENLFLINKFENLKYLYE